MTPAPARTLGTAGHIDHGKTALVRALTGVDTDRLPEEQARGISIALGYASLTLPSGRPLSVVDVPGHERFVRTMIAGATGIDLALLVVACDDGVMPQTREHVAILELLGVRTAVVALSKRDLVDDDGASWRAPTSRSCWRARHSPTRAIVETSAARRRRPRRAARRARRGRRSGRSRGPAARATRMPIDRAFTLHGIGTVVTGTLWSGAIATGDRLALLPGAGRGAGPLRRGARPAGRARRGRPRVAASLVGVERGAIPRGGDARHARRVPRELPPRRRAAGAPLQGQASGTAALVQVLIGTACVDARVALLDSDGVPAGSSGLAQLRLREPVAAARGDRVILRTTAPQATIAGGLVLDPAPPRHGGSDGALARLRLLAGGDATSIVRAALEGAPWPLALHDVAPRGLLDRDAAARGAGRARRLGNGAAARRRRAVVADGRRATPSCARRRAARSSAVPPSTRSSRRCPRARSSRPGRAPTRCSRASRPTAPSSATARTSSAPARGPPRRTGTRPRPRRCWPRSPRAASRRPTCRRCRPPRG